MLPQPKLWKTPFLQFRAGTMTYEDGVVSPCNSRGYLSFIDDGTDVIEMIWSGEGTNLDVSLPIKKGETEVEFVEQCTTGRVMLFTINKGAHKGQFFFWLQDKSTEKDNTYLESIKTALAPKQDSSKTAPRTIQLAELQRLISSISSNNNDISLRKLLQSSQITEALLEEPEFYYERIKEHLPEGETWDPKEIKRELQSSHITRATSILGAALKDPQAFRELCRANNLSANGSGVLAFLNAIIESAKKSG
ncbi:unnamed protein product [Phytomonas sp. EM1]|nr:unnamed protein product [Phytomonas sp. EM1]|eukprot:CCW62034.1 unnamed protein product [Phytomonas sp. isolate EM1]